MNYLADILSENNQFKVALKIYKLMPEFECYTKIQGIYEKEMEFNPEILRYTLMENWHEKEEAFKEYCYFLLRMGKNGDVRDLCYKGQEAMRRFDKGGSIEFFVKMLVEARD